MTAPFSQARRTRSRFRLFWRFDAVVTQPKHATEHSKLRIDTELSLQPVEDLAVGLGSPLSGSYAIEEGAS
jgi:hypothetical protein